MKSEMFPFSHVVTGYQWEATLFLSIWEEVEKRYGREVARAVCAKAMYEAGIRLGRLMARKKGRNDLGALKETWEELYPTGPDTEWDGKRFVVYSDKCFIKQILEEYDVPPGILHEIKQVFCNGDQGFVNGFNPGIKFRWGGRIMRGDPRCVWIMEAPEDLVGQERDGK